MSELLFPVGGVLVVFLGIVPALTIGAWFLLRWSPRGIDPILVRGSPAALSLIALPTIAPVAWFASATLHQLESPRALSACLVEHARAETCTDVLLFGLFLLVVLLVGMVRRGASRLSIRSGDSTRWDALERKLKKACATHPALSSERRIAVVTDSKYPACTRGLFRPRVEVSAELVQKLDRDELVAVLLHEMGHLRARDPLGYFVARGALAINPLGRLLQPDFSRYQLAREMLCDSRAVRAGADRFVLAQTLVTVAAGRGSIPTRGSFGGPSRVHLCGHGIAFVRARVHLLVGAGPREPNPGRLSAVDLLVGVLLLVLVLPHLTGANLLEALHLQVEGLALHGGRH